MKRVVSESFDTLFERTKTLLLKVGCEVFLTLFGQKQKARTSAKSLHYRQEACHFTDLPEALRGFKILFLTDPHIGGNIDTIATEISIEIHCLLDGCDVRKTIVLHGGDFVCSTSGSIETSFDTYHDISSQLFQGLDRYPQLGVIGNHDDRNRHFPMIRKHIETQHNIRLLETPEDAHTLDIDGSMLTIHGIHTLSDRLHIMKKDDRDVELDQYIRACNTEGLRCNIVMIHNPDGLNFLLQRLLETSQKLHHPTLFLAGHTHGAMFDIPVLRGIGLRLCKTYYGRYKGWYEPEGVYRDTGNWKLYVSTGMGNSKDVDYRLNAYPEVVIITL